MKVILIVLEIKLVRKMYRYGNLFLKLWKKRIIFIIEFIYNVELYV